jgi:transketolase
MKTYSMRSAYGEALLEAGKRNRNVVALDCDLSKATKASIFGKEFPDRFIEMGIAEQNMMSFAAGLASCGKIPFASTLAVFATMRACEQVRTSICIGNMNVKVVGAYGGLCTAENGPTHQCIADIGIMRSLPNMRVLAPSDAASCKAGVHWAAEHLGPVYIRVLRDDEPVLYDRPEDVDVARGNILRDGKDVALICNGFTTHIALEAAKRLERQGVDALVYDVFLIKPLNESMIVEVAERCGRVVTVEEHNVYCGLGSAVSEVLSQKRVTPMKILGISDYFSDSGNHRSLLEKAGLTAENIVKAALSF